MKIIYYRKSKVSKSIIYSNNMRVRYTTKIKSIKLINYKI